MCHAKQARTHARRSPTAHYCRKLLEHRGSLVIRQLCVLLEPQSIYLSLARVLSDKGEQEEGSLEFVAMMVQVR